MLLRNTVEKLKSPELIRKYEERGRQLAEVEFKRLLDSHHSIPRSSSSITLHSKSNKNNNSSVITSGEGKIKEALASETIGVDSQFGDDHHELHLE